MKHQLVESSRSDVGRPWARALLLVLSICWAPNLIAQSVTSTTIPTPSAGASAAASARGSLLAHATKEMYWIVRVGRERRNDAGSPERSAVFSRTLGESQWKQVTTLRGRVVSLTDRQGELIVLMADGQWLSVWSDGTSLGTPPPAGVQLRAIAGDADGLVALGTVSSASSTQPASTSLYSFRDGAWVGGVDLPPLPDAIDGSVRAIASGDVFFLVPGTRAGEVNVYRMTRGGSDAIKPQVIQFGSEPVASMDLFVAGDRVVLGTIFRTGAVRLISLNDSAAPVSLTAPSTAGFESAAVTSAAENYRLLLSAGETISEQSYRPDGTPLGQLTKLSFGPQGEATSHWNQFIVMFGIAVMLFAVSRRRGGVIELPAQLGVRLAPIFPRLAAGAVDALPLLLTAGILSYNLDFNQPLGSDLGSLSGQQAWWMSLATAVYLLHTSVSELLIGRTLGKWIFKLWVVSIDTQPARPGQIVTRNLLRVLDVSMAGFPLLLMFASPLRQRVGDLAAGTMVVAKSTTPVEDSPAGEVKRSLDLDSEEKSKM